MPPAGQAAITLRHRHADRCRCGGIRSLTCAGPAYCGTVLAVRACADEQDELAALEVYNTVWPHDAATIGAVHSFRASARDYVDDLVREDGVILGSGVGAIFAYRPRRVVALTTVLAGHRRRGAGTALYAAISVWAGERGAGELEVPVAGDDPQSLSFARRRGFTEERREVR
jgi:GNAT superfamily N-acetyltransferase